MDQEYDQRERALRDYYQERLGYATGDQFQGGRPSTLSNYVNQ